MLSNKEHYQRPHHVVDLLRFRGYNADEIRKLSVKLISACKTFDELGHPVKGGLYDPGLGPTDQHGKCETCELTGIQCPGHFGHIQLPLPAFNPFFYEFTLKLLRGSCLYCHKLLCGTSSVPSKLILAQLRCLELGCVTLVDQLKSMLEVDDPKAEATVNPNTLGAEIAAKMDSLDNVDELIARHGGAGNMEECPPVRGVVELRSRLVSAFTLAHLYRSRGKCNFCQKKLPAYANEGGRSILLNFERRKKKVKIVPDKDMPKAAAGDENEDQDVNEEELNALGSVYSQSTSVNEQLRAATMHQIDQLCWRGAEVREHLREVWKNDGWFLEKIFPMFQSNIPIKTENTEDSFEEIYPVDMLFFEVLPVPPTRFRPMRFMDGSGFEDPQTANLRSLLEVIEVFDAVMALLKGSTSKELLDYVNTRVRMGKNLPTKFNIIYGQLQSKVNGLYDTNANKDMDRGDKLPGMRQILEKKEGLFRKHMMGKRVNYACRSVITPDPYLAVDEIGLPEVFASKLTFSEPCTSFNLTWLRSLVENGPNVYPGANFVITAFGQKKALLANKNTSAEARMLSEPDYSRVSAGSKTVLRHLQKGDIMLMNRQPTLHKPSIMAHRARVLKGQKALRMNYAPCKAYNADFDGDEMNAHFVQNNVARAEAYELMSVRRNYSVPKDGSPILGLIQDHVVSGVLLTVKDRFFTKEDYCYLVQSAFEYPTRRFITLPPALVKPQRWTGKQVLSTVVLNTLPRDKPPLNLDGKAKTGIKNWQIKGKPDPDFDLSESHVVFRGGELLVGVLDKAHYGATAFGLVHSCTELYGPVVACQLLSAFSRLFTTFLQVHGFSLGVADILVGPEAEKKRRKTIRHLRKCGTEVARNAFGLTEEKDENALRYAMRTAYCNTKNDRGDVKQLDFAMKQGLDKFNVDINKAVIPHGLIRLFPHNGLQLMIESGAKGTTVNAMQISCMLGQIELEGCRPPLTASGRTLPSFKCYDLSPRAGGFVDQRFLTGVKPQELFFHTMAGRDGLIDTACKTSRSGYLQRCLIKHLEGLIVSYDLTVRDSDKSIIQFRYGEDGMETSKVQFLDPKQYRLMSDNYEVMKKGAMPPSQLTNQWTAHAAEKHFRRNQKNDAKATQGRRSGFLGFYSEWLGESSAGSKDDDKKSAVDEWHKMSEIERQSYDKMYGTKYMAPVNDKLNPQRSLGALPERILQQIGANLESYPDTKRANMRELIYWKGIQALVEPGTNVGLLAAQSIGEPSTQMTLNTFHFAGRGEMNVTLGIPRLREILMTASKSIATPLAMVPFQEGVTDQRAEEVRRTLDTIYLKQVLKRYSLEESVTISAGTGSVWASLIDLNPSSFSKKYRRYTLRMYVLRQKDRDPSCRHVTRSKIIGEIERVLAHRLGGALGRKQNDISAQREIEHRKMRKGAELSEEPAKRQPARGDAYQSSDEEGDEMDASDAKLKRRHDDAAEYEGEDEEAAVTAEPDDEEEKPADGDKEKEGDEKDKGDGSDESGADEDKQPMNSTRVELVTKASELIVDYKYDARAEKWCYITYQLPLHKSKLDVATIVKREMDRFVVQQIPGITKCIIRQENNQTLLQTQGVNLSAFFKFPNELDVNKVYTNDIHTISNTYGIEAAAKAIIKEVEGVFGCYGIAVDKRHLSLTADYMTHIGSFQPFNRTYMKTSASPLQKMSYESTMQFMRDSMMLGEDDCLDSPSAAIVLGQLSKGGTGAFDLLIDWKTMVQSSERRIKLEIC